MLPDDVPAISRWMVEMPLWKRYGVTEASASAQFNDALKRGDLLLVADADAAACGFAWCLRGGAFGRSDYLRLIGVRPDCAGQGIGAALLTEVEQQAHSRDLFLLVSDFNEGAQRFYRRMGYEQLGAIPGYVVADVTELIFRKRLHELMEANK
ncbi:MAG TPA: GNAT family N-acetyltransferase [Phototrophicaceae bacterium]|nr:GNAT family N-acetyltransferase [Phototrophicaceae bacterium]